MGVYIRHLELDLITPLKAQKYDLINVVLASMNATIASEKLSPILCDQDKSCANLRISCKIKKRGHWVSITYKATENAGKYKQNTQLTELSISCALNFSEREGFEPPVPLPAHLISSQAQSTTLSSLLFKNYLRIIASIVKFVNIFFARKQLFYTTISKTIRRVLYAR